MQNKVWQSPFGGLGSHMMAKFSSSAKAEDEEKLKCIGESYDGKYGKWETLWGEHLHNGYYEPGSIVSLSDHPAAQIRMIEEVLHFASVSDDPNKKPRSVVDVGCGVGGSSLYLAKKYDAHCKGINISPLEVERAQVLAEARGLESQVSVNIPAAKPFVVSFEVADALAQPFPDGQFDLVWIMESAEYVADKLVRELARVAAPGATIIIVSWCHRDLSPSDQSLKPDEEKLMRKMCDSMFLSPLCSTADYIKLLKSHSLEDVKAADWSQYASPFWPVMYRSAFTWKSFISLLRPGGWKAMKLVLAIQRLMEGQKRGLFKLAIISCRKSE